MVARLAIKPKDTSAKESSVSVIIPSELIRVKSAVIGVDDGPVDNESGPLEVQADDYRTESCSASV